MKRRSDRRGKAKRPPPEKAAHLEIEHHLAELTDRLVERGVNRRDATLEAHRMLGNATQLKATLRERLQRRHHRQSRSRFFGQIWQDLRYAMRLQRRTPVATAAILITLALGVGANVAVYSLLDAVVLRPLEIADADKLVSVYHTGSLTAPYQNVAYATYQRYRDEGTPFESLAASGDLNVGVRQGEFVDRLPIAMVSGNFFHTLGVTPIAGRVFDSTDEGTPGSTPYAVISQRLSQRIFGNATAIGETIELNGTAMTVVGVVGDGFQGLTLADPVELWIPVTMVQSVANDGLFASPMILDTHVFGFLHLFGKLRIDVTAAQASQAMNQLSLNLREELGDELPINTDVPEPISLVPVADSAALDQRGQLLRFLGLLSVVVALTLVIAVVNVANLLVARGVARQQEFATRAALGASRGRLFRQLMIESLLVGMVGAALGLAMAKTFHATLTSFTLPGDIPLQGLHLGIDLRVVLFTVGLSVAATVAFGTVPALTLSKHHRLTGSRQPPSAHARAALVALQVALSLVLLGTTTLFTRSIQATLRIDPGFRVTDIAALSIGMRQHGVTPEQTEAFTDRLMNEFNQTPGWQTAMAVHVPPAPPNLRMPVHPTDGWGDRQPQRVPVNAIVGSFFDVLDIQLLHGRLITPQDRAEAPRVAVVSESAGRILSPDQPPIGQTFQLVRLVGDPIEIVGIVEDVRSHHLAQDPVPYIYVPAPQHPQLRFIDQANIVTYGTASSVPRMEAVVDQIDPTLPTFDQRTMEDQMDRMLMPQRFGVRLIGILSLIALAVSSTGIGGLVAYTMGWRRKEFGIRMALGAREKNIVALGARETALAVLAGTVIGGGVMIVGASALRSFLVAVEPLDPTAHIVAIAALILVGLTAAYIPARQAAGAGFRIGEEGG